MWISHKCQYCNYEEVQTCIGWSYLKSDLHWLIRLKYVYNCIYLMPIVFNDQDIMLHQRDMLTWVLIASALAEQNNRVCTIFVLIK